MKCNSVRCRVVSVTIFLFMVVLVAMPVQAQFVRKKKHLQPGVKNSMMRIEKMKTVQRFRLPTRTEVKVWTGQGGLGKENFIFVDEFFVSNQREDLNWWIQWETEEKGVAKGLIQVSLFPFNNALKWDDVPGLLLSREVQASGKTGLQPFFEIDFALLLGGSRHITPMKANVKRTFKLKPGVLRKKTAVTGAGPGKKDIRTGLIRPGTQKRFRASGGIKPISSIKPSLYPINHMAFRRILPRDTPGVPVMTFHIRMVPLNSAGRPQGTPSNAAILRWGESSANKITWFENPNGGNYNEPPRKINNPALRIVEYKPFHGYRSEWCYHYIVTKDIDLGPMQYRKGQRVYFPPKKDEGGVWNAVKDAANAIVDAIGDAVNAVSKAYASIKEEALNFAINMIPGCKTQPVCKSGLAFAMDYGLASIGIPPSLPNFDDLKDMGKDYLVQYAAEQSQLPVGEAARVIDKFMEETDKAAAGGSWLKLDTSFQYSDAVLVVEVWNPTSKPTDPSTLTIRQFERLFDFPNHGKDFSVPVPSLLPGARIKVPIVMPPNTMQYTPGAEMLQRDWNKLAEKGVLLTVYGSYGDNRPDKDQMIVHNRHITR